MNTIVTPKPGAASAAPGVEPVAERRPHTPRAAETPLRPANRRWLAMAAIAVLAGAGGWGLHLWTGARAGLAASGSGENEVREGKATLGYAAASATGKGGSAGTPLQTVPVEVVRRSNVLRLPGNLMADEESSVASNASGIVAEVRVDRGSVVRKNDILVQLDPVDAKNKLAEGLAMIEELKARLGLETLPERFVPEDQPEVKLAQASLDLATSNLHRVEKLREKKVISTEAFDQAQTEFHLASYRHLQALQQIRQSYQACKTAMVKLAILEKAVADTAIRAPFDGWVAEKLVAVGEQISSGPQSTKVITLVRIDPLRLSLSVPQQSIGEVQLGQTVKFEVDSFPGRQFEGTVRFVAPVVTGDTRSLIVEAVVANPDRTLRPGLFATAELQLHKEQAEMFLPASAVEKTGEASRVFVVRGGVAREQVVSLGEVNGAAVQITSGLTGKERVVARPDRVRDGDTVRP
ncbi:MAG: efflux RND transporter periplasmic adaptor subunit [Pirellulales bacterium]